VSPPPQPVIGRRQILDDPHGVAEELLASNDIYGLADLEVRWSDPEMTVFWLTLKPWAPMLAANYPVENVAITVWADGPPTAVPINARTRSWAHRSWRSLGDHLAIGELCLWYPEDPRGLRWTWADGFTAFVTIVHRHLLAEEFNRRYGGWPVEDAPHGAGAHPIRTEPMRRAAYPEAS